MTEALDKSPENRKKLPLTAGTAIFVFACFLLVAGLCKFSFYVLKNHRSAVSRDEFIQAYVDVQPFSAEKKPAASPYIIFKDSTENAPAAFYKPQSAVQTVAKADLPAAPAPTFKRPPVIRPNPASVSVEIPVENDDDIPDADNLPVSLDDLLVAGQSVLDASDQAVLDSQDLLTDDETAVAETDAVKPDLPDNPTAPKAVAQAEPVGKPVSKQAAKPEQTAERWIDIAALREKIKKEQANESFMNGGTKTAAAAAHETDAIAEPKQTPVPAPAAVAKTEPAKPASSPFLTKEQLAQKSEFLPKSPWKVAKVGGKSANALAVKKEVSAPDKPRAKESPTPQETAKIIYKNGRAKKIEQPADSEKSLNWLDRKEAAVWTSLSQSDAPSVWTISDSRPAETAKAFRIAAEDAKPAEEQPAETAEISSAPVRTVGKAEKPEAIANPVLLPLGPAAGLPVSATQTAPQAASKPAQSSAPVIPAPSGSAKPSAEEKGTDSSLVNKLFSIFSQPEESTLPSLGSNVETSDKKDSPAPAPVKKQPPPQAAALQNVAPKTDTAKEQSILPTEIRLTFKPNGTDISAQSVKWIKAFGLRVKKDIQRAIEVRMSNENIPLQEKRFALIRSTLVGVGVDDAQIVPFMTNRSPHTIILRMFDVPEEGVTEYTTSLDGMKETLYYRKW